MGGFHKPPGSTAFSESQQAPNGWVRLADGSMVRAGSPAAEAVAKVEAEAEAEARERLGALAVG